MPTKQHRVITGRLVGIDLTARTVQVRIADDDRLLTIMPGTTIHLNDEPVRLRMLQAGDPVEVRYRDGDSGPVAISVRVAYPKLLPAQNPNPGG